MIDTQEVLHLAQAIAALTEAQERLRVASMADERLKCKQILQKLLNELGTALGFTLKVEEAKVVGRYSEQELDELCGCGHSRRMHFQAGDGRCRAGVTGPTPCTCQGFLLK